MIEPLNEDLAREFQAVIAYTVYSQTLKGAAFSDIARELAVHAVERLTARMGKLPARMIVPRLCEWRFFRADSIFRRATQRLLRSNG